MLPAPSWHEKSPTSSPKRCPDRSYSVNVSEGVNDLASLRAAQVVNVRTDRESNANTNLNTVDVQDSVSAVQLKVKRALESGEVDNVTGQVGSPVHRDDRSSVVAIFDCGNFPEWIRNRALVDDFHHPFTLGYFVGPFLKLVGELGVLPELVRLFVQPDPFIGEAP